jgi:hypothetical protein
MIIEQPAVKDHHVAAMGISAHPQNALILPDLFSQKICDILRNYSPSQSPFDWGEYDVFCQKYDTSRYISAKRRGELGIITLSDFPESYDALLTALGDHKFCMIDTEKLLLRCLTELEGDLSLAACLAQLKDDSGQWSTNKVVKLFDAVLGGSFGETLAWEEIFEKLYHPKQTSSQRYQISMEKMKGKQGRTMEERACIQVFWKYVSELNNEFFKLYPSSYGIAANIRYLLTTLLKSARKAKRPCLGQGSHADLESDLPGDLALFVISEHPGSVGVWLGSHQTIDFVQNFSDEHRERFEEEFRRRIDLHASIGLPDDSLEVKEDIAWDCITCNAMDEHLPRLPVWANFVFQIRSLEGAIMGKNTYHYGGEFPNPLALAEESKALALSEKTKGVRKSGTLKEDPDINLRLHFYNCAEFVGSAQDDTSLPQSERSMVEKTTQDYRVDREMAPIFHRLPHKLPKHVTPFNRVEVLAAEELRKEKAQLLEKTRKKTLDKKTADKRQKLSKGSGGGDAGDGGSVRKTSSDAIARSDSGSSAVTRLRAGSAAGAVGAGSVSGD